MPHVAAKMENPDYKAWEEKFTTVDPKTGKRTETAEARERRKLGVPKNWGEQWIDDPFAIQRSKLLAAEAKEFSPIAKSALSVRTEKGSRVQPGRGTSRFVIPKPKDKSRTLGSKIGSGSGLVGLAIALPPGSLAI